MRGSRRIAERLRKTFKVVACRPDVCNVCHYFYDVRDRRSLPRQSSLDLVKGIAALPGKISGVQDRADRSVFVFRTDSGQKNHFARSGNSDDFREPSLGPLTVIEIVLFKIWHDVGLRRAIIC